MEPDYQKICGQLQQQRNSFADAHAAAAARADQLAEEVERLKAQNATNNQRVDEKDAQIRSLTESLRIADETAGRQRSTIEALIPDEPEVWPVPPASDSDCPF